MSETDCADWWILWDAHIHGDREAFAALADRVEGAGPMLRACPELPSFARACGEAWGMTSRSVRLMVHNWMGPRAKVRRGVVHYEWSSPDMRMRRPGWIACSGQEVMTTRLYTTRSVPRVTCGRCLRTILWKTDNARYLESVSDQ